MSDLSSDDQLDPPDDDIDPGSRGKDLSKKQPIREQLLDVFSDVEKGFGDQNDRANDQMDWWDIYNCKLTSKQFYSGNSQIFVPIVYNAVNARVTRFVNQIFPSNKRNIEVTSTDGTQPSAITALLESYVSLAKLRTKVLPAMMLSGDVEGHYNIYVNWTDHCRYTAKRVEKPVLSPEGAPVPDETASDIEEEKVEIGYPDVEVISDSDVCVLPPTADSTDEALAQGGSVTILRRWGKAKIKRMASDGLIDKAAAKALLKQMTVDLQSTEKDRQRQMVWAAGIKYDGGKHALVYETWTNLRIRKGENRLCVSYFAGGDNILGAHVNPLWCDRLPLLSVPVKKIAGSFKGQSGVKFCATMQYAANDAINEGMDSAAYALLPIIMTDPEKNPRIGSMVLALSAIWQTNPSDTQFAEFPPLWKDAFQIVEAAKAEIAATLSVNPSAIVSQALATRLTQAQAAVEQSADVLVTADCVTVVEEGILSPLATLFAELDHQYRDDDIAVRQYGELGIQAAMETVPPLQMDTRYTFRWLGVEAAKNAQAMQQQIAGINVLRGIPPEQYAGYRLNLVPVLTQMMENLFGPRLAPLIFEDVRQQMSTDPKVENQMLLEGFDLPVHPLDNDPEHMKVHMQVLQDDQAGIVKAHMLKHQQSQSIKAQAQMLAAQQQGQPPGQPQMNGQASVPRIGAQPGQVRNGQQPPGAIHQDQMVDANRVPR